MDTIQKHPTQNFAEGKTETELNRGGGDVKLHSSKRAISEKPTLKEIGITWGRPK